MMLCAGHGHLLCGCKTQAAQRFVCLGVHHQEPGLIVHCFDPLNHLRTGWTQDYNLLLISEEKLIPAEANQGRKTETTASL